MSQSLENYGGICGSNIVSPHYFPSEDGWRQKYLEVGDIVLVETKQKLGKNSYKLARVIKTFLDEAGLCRRVTLEARPRGGKLSLPYVAKDLE